MKLSNNFIWKTLHVLTWVIFIGYCIQSGTLLFTYVYSLFNPIVANNLYEGLNLSQLYKNNQWLYSLLVSFTYILPALKAYVFYLVIVLFKQLNLVKPFSEQVGNLINEMAQRAFVIGVLGFVAHRFAMHLLHKGVELSTVEQFWNDNS
ncbi:MAG: hypothetical protein ACOVQE_00465, partial [Chitinophagaceae bacterium]